MVNTHGQHLAVLARTIQTLFILRCCYAHTHKNDMIWLENSKCKTLGEARSSSPGWSHFWYMIWNINLTLPSLLTRLVPLILACHWASSRPLSFGTKYSKSFTKDCLLPFVRILPLSFGKKWKMIIIAIYFCLTFCLHCKLWIYFPINKYIQIQFYFPAWPNVTAKPG